MCANFDRLAQILILAEIFHLGKLHINQLHEATQLTDKPNLPTSFPQHINYVEPFMENSIFFTQQELK